MTCSRSGCRREATHASVMLIPAQGHDGKDDSTCAQLHLGERFCHPHALAPGITVPAESRAAVTDALAALGKAAPDFKRARFKAVPLDGAEHAQAERLLRDPTVH